MRRSRKILFSIIICSMIWLLLELTAYVVVQNAPAAWKHQRLTPILMRDPELFWTLVPDLDTDYEGIRVRVDGHGFRGSYPPERWKRPRRILCLGDSVTFGWRVEEADAYPEQLQQQLDASAPGVYSVFNAGIPGHTSFQGSQRLPDLLNRIDPAVVILSYSINDRFPAEQTDAARFHRFRTLKRTFRVSNVIRLLEMVLSPGNDNRFNPMQPGDQNAPGDLNRVMPDAFRENLNAMIDLCRSENRPVILLNEYVNNLPEAYDAYHAATLDIAASKSIPLIDTVAILMPLDIHCTIGRKSREIGKKGDTEAALPDVRDPRSNRMIIEESQPPPSKKRPRQRMEILAFETYDPEDGVMVDTYHPNAEGYRLTAEALADEILNMNIEKHHTQ